MENPAVGSSGVLAWQPSGEGHPQRLFYRDMNPLPLSKSACVGGWRFLQKWFSGDGFAAARYARRCSGSVRTAIAGSAIAARIAVWKPDASNAEMPTAGTSEVPKAGSIIGTGNRPTGTVTQFSA